MTPPRIIQKIEKGLYPLIKLLDQIAWVMLFAMMSMTITDLFLRNFTNSGILGSIEMTEFLMVIMIFCSLAQCEVDNGHIRVDLVMDKVNPRIRAFADVFTQALCTILFAMMGTSIYHHAVNMRLSGEVTMDLHLPIYPFVYVAALGCVAMALVLFVKTMAILTKAFSS